MDEALKDNLDSIEALAREEGDTAGDDAGMINCLLRIAEELSATLDLDAVLQKVAERVKQFIDYDLFAIQLLDPLGQELRIRFGIGYAPEVIKHWRLGLGQGLAGTAAQRGKPVRVGDVTRDPRYIDAGGDVRSEMAIPLIVRKRTIGVFHLGTRRADAFTESNERLLTFLAGHLANAIENARLYENLRVQSRTLSLLHEMSRELTSILDRDKLLRKLAQLVKRLIGYQAFHLMLWDEEKQELGDTLMLRYDERIESKCGMRLGVGITGTAAALRQPVRVPNIHLDPRYVSAGDSIDVRSELAVPLVFKDRLIGVIDLESTEYNAFREEHEEILSTFASYIAIALENARLYEKVRKGEMRLERDLDTAREIQRGLLPDAPPRVPGLDIGFAYAPALQLGGDIYDFLPYADDRLALAVGDVAGKATAAALYGALAIGILRSHVVEHPCEPAEMLESMNNHLRQPRLESKFVALALGVYDNASKIFSVANAGFPRPYLLRGSRIEEIPVEGVPLGLLPDVSYEQKKLALQVGDVIVFCSDGIHECVDRQKEEFGAGRLESLLSQLSTGSAREFAEGILQATDRYVERGRHDDDRTVVALKVTGEEGPARPATPFRF